MRKIKFLLIGLSVVSLCAWEFVGASNKTSLKTHQNKPGEKINSIEQLGNTIAIPYLEIPYTQHKENIVTHVGYSLLYNEAYEQASWVAYEMDATETHKIFERSNKFYPDPKVKTGTATDEDYSHSGYDKGHLAPAADMEWSATAIAESFYYSNMSPQVPGFNRGIWKHLEELVRTWAVENEDIYIVTGPVLTSDLPRIGIHRVAVPKYFYKVILDYRQPNVKAIGFILPNESSTQNLQDFAVSIDKVEEVTGLNFFPLLPDKDENELEANVCISCWNWTAMHHQTHSGNGPKKNIATQCIGITKAGNRCKRMTTNPSGRCYQHLN